MQPGSLDRYLTGRPLYLNVGGEVIKVPTVAKPQHYQTKKKKKASSSSHGGGAGGSGSSGGGKSSEGKSDDDEDDWRLPPADVPEHLLFATIQKLRPNLVAFADRLPSEVLGQQFGLALGTALRLPHLGVQAWVQRPGPPSASLSSSSSSSSASSFPSAGSSSGSSGGGGSSSTGLGLCASGRWDAVGAELSVDLQTTEVMWRNDELKPVPDSMAQYADYASMFGKQPLHCGLVVRQEHRHWVHLVGSE